MSEQMKMKALDALKIAVTVTPWLASMYFLYWLGKNEVWTPETAHRDKITIVTVALGMGLSFLIYSNFTKRAKK